jgi:hypothetical protein
MRWLEINEVKKPISPVEWPSNLAWRIEFRQYRNLPPILDIRKGKIFAMPFRNWEGTYYKLTLKEPSKVKFMNTSVVEVPDDALVSDMRTIDLALKYYQSKNDPTGSMKREGEKVAKWYLNKMVSYREFVKDPGMFQYPEILLDRGTVKFLPYKVTIADYVQGKDYQLGLAPK